MLAEATGVPGAFNHLVLRADVQELTVVLGTLPVSEEMAEGHAGHVVLMQVFTLIAFLALTSQPMFAHVRSLHSLMSHRALESCLASAPRMPGVVKSQLTPTDKQ